MPAQSGTLERETIYSLLADGVREYVLRRLSKTGRTTVSEIADRITTTTDDQVVAVERVRTEITIQLVHNHLPRLDQHDVVDYDDSSGVITTGSNFGELEPYVASPDAPVDSQ